MNIERNYIRQFLNESKKKFEENGYLYAYTTRAKSMDSGWVTANSKEELQKEWAEWENEYGKFEPSRIMTLRPATSVDKAMVLVEEPEMGDTIIYPSIKDAINGPNGLKALGWKEGETLTQITAKELRELLKTKDLKRAEELLTNTFVDSQDYGYFEGLYEHVSGPKPDREGTYIAAEKNPETEIRIKELSDTILNRLKSYGLKVKDKSNKYIGSWFEESTGSCVYYTRDLLLLFNNYRLNCTINQNDTKVVSEPWGDEEPVELQLANYDMNSFIKAIKNSNLVKNSSRIDEVIADFKKAFKNINLEKLLTDKELADLTEEYTELKTNQGGVK